MSQGARVHLTDPQLSRKASKSTLSGSLERLSMSPGPILHTRQHPYIRPPSRTNSRDAGSLPVMPERPHPLPLLDDWASCSSDGLPSLPTSPGWARAEEQVWSLVRHTSPSVMSECQGPSVQPEQAPSRSHSLDEYPRTTPVHMMPQARSKTAQESMLTSSLHSDSAISTMQIIQRLNLESSYEQQLHASCPLFHGAPPVTASPEASPADTRRRVHEVMLDAHVSHDATHTSQNRESIRSSLDMDLSEEDMMGSDLSHSDMLYCSSSYMSERDIPPANLLSVGDHVGPGLYHDGDMIRIAQTRDGLDAHDPSQKPKPLEVVRLLGQGSYAVVYLVRELSSPDSSPSPPPDMDSSVASTPRGQNESHPFSPSKTPRQGDHGWSGKEHVPTDQDTYYALKCLSKRNLTPEQAFTQQNELSTHQSIPSHPNIITLHSAYETADWLFLVLEYCPGKDLYFWLEEARDEWGMQSSASVQSQVSSDASAQEIVSVEQNTSYTPWLLSITSRDTLLSERRLQFVGDIFQQMCKAVQFCHDLGISHRDLKPENFIVEDRRGRSGKSDDQVIVKLTDFGLATSETFSRDFNCGSKPYMAFECRHDLSSCYDPKQSDIWSLGVVLLNLIFHRSPFKDASVKHCASFAAFTYNPILFLTQAFEGMTEDVARFLHERVFCDVSRQQRSRIAPLAFGQWAQGLPQMLGKRPRLSESGSPSSIFAPVSLSQTKSDDEEHTEETPSNPSSTSTYSQSSSHVLGSLMSGHGSANDSVDGASSLNGATLNSVPSDTMSGSLSMSRSPAPFHNALHE